MISSRWTAPIALTSAGAALGMWLGWALWSPKKMPAETYAAPQRQQDGSLVLERKPQADAKPAHQIPKGAKLERVVQVSFQPTGDAGRMSGASLETLPPAGLPFTLDLSLVKMPDETHRVVVSSPDGVIVGGVDIPVQNVAPARELRWAAGGSWNPGDKTYGAWVQRNAGPLVLGVDAFQVREPMTAGGRVTWSAMLRVGIRF